MPAMADRQAQRALLQEQWDSLDDLTARLGQRVRERPNRDVEEGPGHLPDPNVAQELILTRGRLAAVEKERDRLQRRLELARQKLRATRSELRRDRRQLERLGAVPAEPTRPATSPATRPATPADDRRPTGLHVVADEPDIDFEGAPLPDSGPEMEAPGPVDEVADLDATVAELADAVAQLDGMATVLAAAESELTHGAGAASPDAEPQAPPTGHWSARALFARISARWRGRGPE